MHNNISLQVSLHTLRCYCLRGQSWNWTLPALSLSPWTLAMLDALNYLTTWRHVENQVHSKMYRAHMDML